MGEAQTVVCAAGPTTPGCRDTTGCGEQPTLFSCMALGHAGSCSMWDWGAWQQGRGSAVTALGFLVAPAMAAHFALTLLATAASVFTGGHSPIAWAPWPVCPAPTARGTRKIRWMGRVSMRTSLGRWDWDLRWAGTGIWEWDGWPGLRSWNGDSVG